MKRRNPKVKANVARLTHERDRLLREMEAIKNKVEGLELAISLLEKDSGETEAAPRSARGGAKALLLDLLREVGTTGLNASTAVEIAARRGVTLARGTAASNLSRLKADGTVVYGGDKYRLAEFAARPKPNLMAVPPRHGTPQPTILGGGLKTS